MQLLIVDRLITGDGKTVIEKAALAVDEQGCIIAVGPEEEVRRRAPVESAKFTRFDGCSIVPGLIDLHVHIGYWYNKPDHQVYDEGLVALMAVRNLREALSLGVTTIRDVGCRDGLCRTLKNARDRGFIVSPRIFTVNQLICMVGGHGSGLPGATREATGPWEVRAAVREQIRAGADWIKVTMSHRSETPEFTQEELDAAVDEAHRLGKKVAVHASLRPAIQMSIQAGVDTIEHGTFLTLEDANRMGEKGIVWIPTMVTFFRIADHYRRNSKNTTANQGLIDQALKDFGQFFLDSENAYRSNFADLLRTGVRIATGTDIVLDRYPVTPVTEEIALMVELGMPPIKAIQAATQTAAEVLDQGHRLGSLAPGYLADVLVVAGNPLEEITAMHQVRAVLLGGSLVFQKP